MLKKILTMRGAHFVATRFCGSTIRQMAFDEMYKSGKWKFNEANRELTSLVEKQAAKRGILMVGCGTATILDQLDRNAFDYFCGLDISAEAIDRAKQFASDKIEFRVADILDFESSRKFGVILFSESFYYIPASRREALLNRLCGYLEPGGCIIVTLADPERYADIIGLITEKFRCISSGTLAGSRRHVLVFNKK